MQKYKPTPACPSPPSSRPLPALLHPHCTYPRLSSSRLRNLVCRYTLSCRWHNLEYMLHHFRKPYRHTISVEISLIKKAKVFDRTHIVIVISCFYPLQTRLHILKRIRIRIVFQNTLLATCVFCDSVLIYDLGKCVNKRINPPQYV